MLKRLLAVSDQPHFQERFYPILLRDAGTEKVVLGVTAVPLNSKQLSLHRFGVG